MDDKLKKQLISILNTSMGANIIKDVELSTPSKNVVTITCQLLNNKTKTCEVHKDLIELLKKPIIKWT